MHGTDQRAAADQELPGRPVEPPPGVRTDVDPGPGFLAVAQYDEGFRALGQRGVHRYRGTVGNVIEAAKRPGG